MRIGTLHKLPKVLIRIASTVSIVVMIASGAQAQSTSEGQALFGAKCFSCHNVGGGDKQGPDLKGAIGELSSVTISSFRFGFKVMVKFVRVGPKLFADIFYQNNVPIARTACDSQAVAFRVQRKCGDLKFFESRQRCRFRAVKRLRPDI